MQPLLDRRRFLTGAALSPLVIGNSALAESPIQRVGGAKLKTSLNAYSFSKLLNDNIKGRGKGMTYLELLDYCAEQGFDAIDPTGYFFPGYPKPPTDKYLNDFKRRAFQLGLDISGTGVRNNFASPDKEKRAADLQHVKEWVEVAARMGAPVLRVFAGPESKEHKWEQVAEWMAEELKKCAEYGQKYGVHIGIQNHGDMLKNADEVLKLVKLVNSEWFGVVLDTGYFMTDDPYKDMARVLPHAVNWQVKEKILRNQTKEKIDLKKIVQIAKEGGYRGYMPIETLPESGEEYEPRSRVAALLKQFREELKKAE